MTERRDSDAETPAEVRQDANGRSRPVALADLSPLHRAAVVALVRGTPGVRALAAGDRPGVDDADVALADYLLVHLRRRVQNPTEAAALQALADNAWLLERPDGSQRAHPCPLCRRPALGRPRYPASVCDDCAARTACREGRTVTGFNTSLAGGFEAQHADDGSVCAQVTRDGRCWIDGQECAMGEARFGGVYVVLRAPARQP